MDLLSIRFKLSWKSGMGSGLELDWPDTLELDVDEAIWLQERIASQRAEESKK